MIAINIVDGGAMEWWRSRGRFWRGNESIGKVPAQEIGISTKH